MKSSRIILAVVSFLSLLMLMGSQGYGESHVLKKKSSRKEGFLVNHNRFGAPIRDAEGRPIYYTREELQAQDQAWRLRQPLMFNAEGLDSSIPKASLSSVPSSSALWSFGASGYYIGSADIIVETVNGKKEIYVNAGLDYISQYGRNAHYWYTLVYNNSTGSYEKTFVSGNFQKDFSGSISGIKVGDVTGDSRKEIIVASFHNIIRLYDQETKKILKEVPTTFLDREKIHALEVFDFGGDSKCEIVVGTDKGIYVVSDTGKVMWSRGADISRRGIIVGQMDNDVALEMAFILNYDDRCVVVDCNIGKAQWIFERENSIQIKAADIDNDNMDELIIVDYNNKITAYDVELQLPSWTLETAMPHGAIEVADVDNDSVPELLVGSRNEEHIVAYNTITLEQEFEITGKLDEESTNITVADVDGDGVKEVLSGTEDGEVFKIWDWRTNEREWEDNLAHGPYAGPELGDLDGDGKEELVIVSESSLYQDLHRRILVFDLNGKLRGMSTPIVSEAICFADNIKLFDVDGDGKKEIMVAGSLERRATIHIYDYNADNTFTLIWSTSTTKENIFFNGLSAGDIDNDGQVEIVGGTGDDHTTSSESFIYVYDFNTGSEEWCSSDLGGESEGISTVEVCDIDNDGIKEIVALVYNRNVYIYNGKTKALKTTHFGPFTAMAIVNINRTPPSLAVGNYLGEIEIMNSVGGVYRTVFEKKFVETAIDGISKHSTYDEIIFSTDGTLKIGLYDGTIKWSSIDYGFPYGKNAVIHPGGDFIYGVGNFSLNAFEYKPVSTAPSIRVTSPNGGEAWDVGTTQSITWTSSWSVGNVKIEYSTDNGGTWSTITDAVENNGSYSWVIPNTVSGQCLVKVSEAADGSPADTSNAVFSITSSSPNSSISVSSPNGGELLSVGTSYPISWFTAGSVGNVKIEYSTDNGGTWSTVTNSTINNGNYSWTVPNTPSDKCLVRISDAAGGSPSDTGDAVFEITTAPPAPAVTVNSPNGGEYLMVGGTYPISWYATGGITNVKIQYSTDNGGSWSTITNSVPNTGSYSWTIPNAASGRCLVRVSNAAGGSPSDVSNGTFSITTNPTPPTLTVSSPNGGEVMTVGTTYPITWYTTGTVGGVKIEYSTNNGGSWSTIVNSTLNTGNYSWTVPNTVSDSCVVRISDVANGIPSDTGNTVFSITPNPIPPSINIASPNGGETWRVGSIQTISWYSTGSINNVKIQYSVNNGGSWSTIASSTPNDGKHSIIVPNTISGKCLIKVSDTAGKASDKSSGIFSITTGEIPEITLDRSELTFYSIIDGGATGAQTFTISNSGDGVLVWNLSVDTPVVICTPMSGSGYQVVSVSVNPAGLIPGIYRGSIKVIALDAENQSKIINVTLTVKHKSECEPPFGEFSTPVEGVTVSGSIPVTGWVLDDIGVESVKIYNGDSYVGDAVFVEGARPDVEAAYQGYPNNNKAGWGYMLLTNFLPGGGNGTYTLNAVATDKEGNEVTLGSRTIVVDNANAVKPFGAIDTPAQGGLASGKAYINWGWVLTPQPNSIPLDGSTIDVWVNGVAVGKPTYNIYREDIATLFPNFVNSNGAVGYFYLDTTGYDNGAHTIQWTAKDSGGNIEGIGSRYFMIGRGNNRQATSGSLEARRISSTNRAISSVIDTTTLPVDDKTPVDVKKGYYRDSEASSVFPQENGTIRVEIEELERLEIKLAPGTYSTETLPVGSQLDTRTGTFYWQPGPGFLGDYLLEFVQQREDGVQVLRKLLIIIKPKY
jgi:hypothetical protein